MKVIKWEQYEQAEDCEWYWQRGLIKSEADFNEFIKDNNEEILQEVGTSVFPNLLVEIPVPGIDGIVARVDDTDAKSTKEELDRLAPYYYVKKSPTMEEI